MTNKQLAIARKIANQFPNVTFTPSEGGILVGGQTVQIGPNMTPANVEKALKEAAYGAENP
jgi:hypothetical protein